MQNWQIFKQLKRFPHWHEGSGAIPPAHRCRFSLYSSDRVVVKNELAKPEILIGGAQNEKIL